MKRYGKIWNTDQGVFTAIIAESDSFLQALQRIGLTSSSTGSYRSIKDRITHLGLDVSHFYKKHKEERADRLRNLPRIRKPLVEYLVKNGSILNIRHRLFSEGVLSNKCVKCHIGDVWQNERLSLQIDHINGCNTDNRIENLRVLCPNCHSQTHNFAGKKLRQRSKRSRHDSRIWARRFDPSKEEMLYLVSIYPLTAIAKKFGVSDTAVKKRCRLMGIQTKGRKPPKQRPHSSAE